jgi:hypothetical protein
MTPSQLVIAFSCALAVLVAIPSWGQGRVRVPNDTGHPPHRQPGGPPPPLTRKDDAAVGGTARTVRLLRDADQDALVLDAGDAS